VLLGLEAGRLGDRGRDVPDVLHLAEDLRRGLDAAAAELRRLVHGLMPAVLVERGLVAAIEDLVDLMPLPTTLDVTGMDGELSPMVETTAYFVVAEALTNAAKHSRANKVTVVLHRSQDLLRLEITDDGRGTATVGGGAGLRGLADRLDVVGGSLHVDSDPAYGTIVVGEVPCGR
jgi:signal transduction histidine kinase